MPRIHPPPPPRVLERVNTTNPVNYPPPNLAIAKLERLLVSRRMTYSDLARELRVDRATITHWRAGQMPRRDKIDRIAELTLGAILPADWLTPLDLAAQ